MTYKTVLSSHLLIFLFSHLFPSPMRILVWLSGWVDSAVTTHLLQQQGHDVIAGFMKNYTDESNPQCTTRQDRDMAIKVASHLGIKTFVITDFRTEYQQRIINYIITTYQQGLTPNPDVFCNNEIKFWLFLDEALKLWCDAVATGHYATIVHTTSNNAFHDIWTPLQSSESPVSASYSLLQGIDPIKDQSYFLSRLSQAQLSKSILPLGIYTKQQIRDIAHQIWLPNADRPDSQGLCFIGDIPMREFLAKYLPVTPWPIVDTSGKQLGSHQGAYFYTIGQRHGLGINQQVYVLHIDIPHNTVIVWPKDSPELVTSHCVLKALHTIHPWYQRDTDLYQVKIRYRQPLQTATIHADTTHDSLTIHFSEPQRAIAPGQIGVIYRNGKVLGSGIIE